MASTYTERKVALDEIAQRSEANRKRLAQAYTQISTAVSDLTAMETAYTTLVSEINTDATDNPNDEALQAQKLEKDKLAADFVTLKSTAEAQKAALDAL